MDDDLTLDSAVEPQPQSSSEILLNMEGLIKSHMSAITRLQDEAKKLKEMLDDIFSNDPTFQEHDKAAKEATKQKQATKQQILRRPQAKELDDKIKTLKSEAKESQIALSDYLQEYQRLSGVTEIEGDDGQLHQIVYIARLVKRSTRL